MNTLEDPMLVKIGMIFIFFYAIGSMIYVYKFRGNTRYENFSEYLRKGWFIFAPLNSLLYLFTQPRGKKPIMDLKDFRELDDIQENWEVIKEEVKNLNEQGYLQLTNKPGSGAYYDLGFRTFYKYGWSKFYLTWYGHTLESAKKLCPNTVKILENNPAVNGAMFSILPVGSKLTRHLDPIACSLRYHLGLATPNSDDCYINVDGTFYAWKDGEAFLFDETYLHYAYNNSVQERLILMCDVKRPLNFIGSLVNVIYMMFARMSVVPNIEGDKRGLINIIYSSLAPINKKLKQLKQTNRGWYKFIKHTINLSLLLILVSLLAGSLKIINAFIKLVA